MARPSPLISELPEVRELSALADAPGSRCEFPGVAGGAARWMSEPDQDRLLAELVRGEAATVLGHASADESIRPGRSRILALTR